MKKYRTIIILIIAILLLTGTTANADNTHSFEATITPQSKKIMPKEEISITLSISDINMGEDGINTLEGTIKYDKEVFEKVTSSNIKSQNNWSITYNDEKSTLNGKFLAFNMSEGEKGKTNIFTVTLKAKENITKTTTTQIEFKDITSNDGTNLINAGTKKVDVIVEAEEIENHESNNGQTNVKTLNTKTLNTGKWIIVIAGIFAISAICILKKKKRYKSKEVYYGKKNK